MFVYRAVDVQDEDRGLIRFQCWLGYSVAVQPPTVFYFIFMFNTVKMISTECAIASYHFNL